MASPPSPPPQELLTAEKVKAIRDVVKSHQYIFVDPFPEEVQYECSVCLGVLEEPQITDCCGGRYCLNCIISVKSKKCPLCNEQGLKYFPDKRLERQIKQRKVFCTMKNEGCEWTGEYCKVEMHLDIDGTDNSTVCQYLPVQCKHCKEYSRRRDIERHQKTCKEAPTLWLNHKAHGGLRYLACEYEHVGCKVKVLRIDMEEHLKVYMADHLEMVKLKLRQLEEEKESKGKVDFLVISELPDEAVDEHVLKSRFGQFGPLDFVELLDEGLNAGVVVYLDDDTYEKVLQKSRNGGIKLCKVYVQVNPVYTTRVDDSCNDSDD